MPNGCQYISSILCAFHIQISSTTFLKDSLPFKKTDQNVSNMARDQVHKQNNEYIKGAGGATHLVNRSDDSSLISWELCGSELAKIISDFEKLPKGGTTDLFR